MAEDGAQRDPHYHVDHIGGYEIRSFPKTVEGLDATVISLDRVAKAEEADDAQRKNSKDNYERSFESLMNAFDTFLQEYGSNLAEPRIALSAGNKAAYDLSKRCDATVRLCWAVRNAFVHHGGLVNKKSKGIYEKIHAEAQASGADIPHWLPPSLREGLSLAVTLKKYEDLKRAVFEYISERVSEDDLKTLSMHSVTSEFRTDDMSIVVPMDGFDILLSMNDLAKAGKSAIATPKGFLLPGACGYYVDRGQVIFYDDGVPVKAKFVKRGDGRHPTENLGPGAHTDGRRFHLRNR